MLELPVSTFQVEFLSGFTVDKNKILFIRIISGKFEKIYTLYTFSVIILIFAGPRCVQRGPDYKLNWTIYLSMYVAV